MPRCFVVFLILVQPLLAAVELRIGARRAELAEMNVSCQLDGAFLIRRMELGFRNDQLGAMEGELICPLADSERIVDYAMEVRGVKRQGVVVSQKRARHAYETIVSRKVDPGILEIDEEKQEFRTRVFPLPKGQVKRVWITTLSVVEDGKVQLWPEGFGSPEVWSLRFSVRGGDLVAPAAGWQHQIEEGRWQLSRRGVRSEIPGYQVTWKAGDQPYYWEEAGKTARCWFVSPEPQSETLGKRIELWVDGTVRPHLDMLRTLLVSVQEAEITLRIFDVSVAEPEVFQVKGGKAAELLERLRTLKLKGIARPQFLPWKETAGVDAIVLMTDGDFVEGNAVMGFSQSPLHVIDAGKGTSEWLRLRALASGGGWHGGGKLDPMRGRYRVQLNPDVQGGLKGDRLVMVSRNETLPEAERGLESPAADWTWGQLTALSMERNGAGREEVRAFRYTHSVQGGKSAWLVLETARDYAEFGIEPPRTEPRLREAWAEEVKREEVRKEQRMNRFADAWKKRCDRLEEEPDSPAQRIEQEIQDQLTFWDDIRERREEVAENDLKELKELLGQVQNRPKKIDAEAERRLLQALRKVEEIDGQLWEKLMDFMVTVGGQVMTPGQLFLMKGATLKDAVEAAGGPTEFASIRRIALFREGRRYTYDLTKEAHRKLRLKGGDTVDVPQTMLFESRGPRKARPETKVTVHLRDWKPSSDAVARVDRALDHDDDDWWGHWEKLKEELVLRPLLYEEVLSFLALRERWKLVQGVAMEFAEFAPSNPRQLLLVAQYLRRAGEPSLAVVLSRRAYELTEEEEGAGFELAASLWEIGQGKEAAQLLWKGIQKTESRDGALVYLEELNAILHRSNEDGVVLGVDPRFLRFVPIALRMNLRLMGESDVVLNVRRELSSPRRGKVSRFHAERGEIRMKDLQMRSWSWRSYLPGPFEVFVGWTSERRTAVLEITQDLGLPSEQRRVLSLLVEKGEGEVGEVKVLPRSW